MVSMMGPRGVVTKPGVITNRSEMENSENYGADNPADTYMDDASVGYATNNMIFILISDIGVDEMTALLLRHGHRANIPLAVLRTKVKGALDAQWDRLHFNKAVTGIAPFLPLEPQHIEQIVELKIRKLSRQFQYKYWLKLHVDIDIIRYLSSTTFMSYKKYSLIASELTNVSVAKANAKGGASSAHSHPPTAGKLFAEFGARGIENSGPMQDLKKHIYRYMQPWRAHQVLHVGLANLGRLTGFGLGAEDDVGDTHVYLQWCHAHETMWTPSPSQAIDGDATVDVDAYKGDIISAKEWEEEDNIRIDSSIAFSPLCETVWHGSFDKMI